MSELVSNKLVIGTMAALTVGGGAPKAFDADAGPTVNSVTPKELHLDEDVSARSPRLGYSALKLSVMTVTRPSAKLHFTGYEVEGLTSTFGPPTEAVGQTADQGNDGHPCIALREDSTLDRKFQVTVFYNHKKFQAIMPHCDWGPASSTGRSIDITGEGVEELHMNPYSYPNSFGIARELSDQTAKPRLRYVRPKSSMLTPSALYR